VHDEALARALGGGVLRVVALCERGSVVGYRATGDSREYAPSGAGPLLQLIAEAAARADAGVFAQRDPDRRTPGLVLCEPVDSTRVVVAITLSERTVAVLRLRQLARELRSLG
jgi:hypothetical protein